MRLEGGLGGASKLGLIGKTGRKVAKKPFVFPYLSVTHLLDFPCQKRFFLVSLSYRSYGDRLHRFRIVFITSHPNTSFRQERNS